MVHELCDGGGKLALKKGPWTPEEDEKLISYVQTHGHGSWRSLPKQAGLARCGKSCRLRWANYLRPGIKRGSFSSQEESIIIQLHSVFGNRWSTIATHLPGRTDNEIKNYWNTRLKKKLLKMGIDPDTHRRLQAPSALNPLTSSINTDLLQAVLMRGSAESSVLLKSLLNIQGSNTNSPATNAGNTIYGTSAVPANIMPNSFNILPTPPTLNSNILSAGPPAAPSIVPAPQLDPALLAAAEAGVALDYLKLGANHQNSDQQLNQLLTRLLLIKLLQSSTYDQRCLNSSQCCPPVSANDPSYNQSFPCPAPAPNSPCSMFTGGPQKYPNYLQQTFPIPAENLTKPCAPPSEVCVTDHMSSTGDAPSGVLGGQSEAAAATNSGSFSYTDSDHFLSPNESLTGYRTSDPLSASPLVNPMMNGEVQVGGGSVDVHYNFCSEGQIDSPINTTMIGAQTWDQELVLLAQQQAADKSDPANSSDVSTNSNSSSRTVLSSSSAGTTNMQNIQDYWSNLLRVVSSTTEHQLLLQG